MADPHAAPNGLEGITKFFKEHFTPLQSFVHSARINMLTYHNRVSKRAARFKLGNHVEFHETVFSDKVQIRKHLKEKWADFKADREHHRMHEKAYEDNQKKKEDLKRTAREEAENAAIDVQMRANRGEPLNLGQQKFLKALESNRKTAIVAKTQELRDHIDQELAADKLAYSQLRREAKNKVKASKQSYKQKKSQKTAARSAATVKWVHETAEYLRKVKGAGHILVPSDQRLLDEVNSIGERRTARAIKTQINEDIHAERVNFYTAKVAQGTLTQRFLGRLQLVSEEACLSLKNIGKNVAEAAVFAGTRAEAAVQLGFDATVDYAQGLAISTYEGAKAGSHAATVKPVKAAMDKVLKTF